MAHAFLAPESQRLDYDIHAELVTVLEAIGDRLLRAVDAHARVVELRAVADDDLGHGVRQMLRALVLDEVGLDELRVPFAKDDDPRIGGRSRERASSFRPRRTPSWSAVWLS